MSDDPNLAPKPRRPRTVGMYDRPEKAAISPVMIIGLVLLILIILAVLFLFVLPH